jgi:hypothetical protein
LAFASFFFNGAQVRAYPATKTEENSVSARITGLIDFLARFMQMLLTYAPRQENSIALNLRLSVSYASVGVRGR